MSHRKLPEEREPRKWPSFNQILFTASALCVAALISWLFYVFILGG